jgi:DHA1 family inner membrane transport protein
MLAYAILALGPPWPVAFTVFVAFGFGFYLLHGFIQLYVTELAPDARGSALALHSAFFFFGQATGPLAFGFGFAHFGTAATLVVAGLGMFANSLVCAGTLKRSAVTEAL